MKASRDDVRRLGLTPPPPADLDNLVRLLVATGFPAPAVEYKFLDSRRFRFDLAWPALKVAFEREGGTWGKGRHTSGKGYRNDCDKYSLAAIEGWAVIRATVDMIRDGTAFAHVGAMLNVRAKYPAPGVGVRVEPRGG